VSRGAKRALIGPELFDFFRELDENNDREWFRKNKSRYESHVRDPLLEFVSAAGPHLEKINPHLVADPRPVGGSLFRIHRDVRFSKDKSPYKTHAGLRFPHEDAKTVHAPGYYLHLEPGAVFAASGIWHPDPETLARVRDAIVSDPRAWKRALSGKAFRARCRLGGDSLKRPPKGYDPQHPLIEDLKRKDFIAHVELSEAEACRPDFMARFTEACRAMKPLVGFLSRAVGIPW
jgi:uncharacterized protein (TIGR02453 family)